MYLSPLTVSELKRIVEESDIVKSVGNVHSSIQSRSDIVTQLHREDDTNWPQKSVVGKQELEIRLGNSHISFELAKLGSLVDVQQSEDSEGLRCVEGSHLDCTCVSLA